MNIEIKDTWIFHYNLMKKYVNDGGPPEWLKPLIWNWNRSFGSTIIRTYYFRPFGLFKDKISLREGDLLVRLQSEMVLHFDEDEAQELDLDKE